MPKEWKKPKPTDGQRAKAASDAKKTIARNKKARHDYTIEDTWEAGLALMGTEDTRQIGIGYIKNFVAVCLAGIIILVLLISFPIILGGLNAANPGTGTPIDGIANGLTYALQYLAMCILLILSLVKSGTWARDIVGG